MKIGFVTGEYPPMEGGVGAFTQELAKALAGQGHEIHVMTGRGARPSASSSRKPGEPYDLGFAQLYPFIGRWRWPSVARIADWTLRHEFEVVNIQYQAAAYNMNSAAINLLPWRLKGITTTIVTLHDLRVPYLFPKAGRWRRTAVNFMAKQASGVIVTNPEDYQSLISNLQSPITQIPIGSNIEAREVSRGEITAVRHELGLEHNDCLLGYFGFLNESKGADTLLRALAELAETFHIVFIGGRAGSSDAENNQAFYAQLDALIAEFGLAKRVHWTGFVPQHHVSTYLKAVDVMVMPYRDGASLRRGTLMAALAHGRPLITTYPPTPTPELSHGDNVWFVAVDDLPALVESIHALWDDPALRARLGAGATQVADLFAWNKIAARTAAFFRQETGFF
jgi:glycosyltransferase involved in cell wall biosynthesis